MDKLTSYERMKRHFERREADRIAMYDVPWQGALNRWEREGMPAGADFRHFLGMDIVRRIRVDVSPRYPEKTLREDEESRVYTTPWGVTMKQFKVPDSTPEFLDYTITSPEKWQEAKKRMTVSADRVDWNMLKEAYPKWQKEGAWIEAMLWFGFDVTHSWAVGTERVLMALIEHPEWCMDMFNHMLDLSIATLDMVWEKGYRFHSVMWYDDMGYKHNQFFSLNTYRTLLKPAHQRAVEWAKRKGVKTYLHSCGCITPFVPDLVEMGLDMLNPLEVKAGMDPAALKRQFGRDLAFHGGINAVNWTDLGKMEAEMERVIPVMKEGGGYVFGSDHSIPNNVGLKDVQRILARARQLGAY